MVLAVFPYVLSDFPTTPQPLHRPLQMNPKMWQKFPLSTLTFVPVFLQGLQWKVFWTGRREKQFLEPLEQTK